MSMLVMACSSLVVNVKGNLVESDLDRLSCFTKMATMIAGNVGTLRCAIARSANGDCMAWLSFLYIHVV
jgi:hypothetical protein